MSRQRHPKSRPQPSPDDAVPTAPLPAPHLDLGETGVPFRQRQLIGPLTTKPLDGQHLGKCDFSKAALPVRGCHRDVVGLVVHGPAIAMFVAKETGQHAAILSELPADLPADLPAGWLEISRSGSRLA